MNVTGTITMTMREVDRLKVPFRVFTRQPQPRTSAHIVDMSRQAPR